MILKCKICGGDLSFQQGDIVATCEYCGRQQTLPLVREQSMTLSMYELANSYRTSYEFDKAINIYDQIILGDKNDAEAYWNRVLCKYGVVYVIDPKTNKYIPTCSRTQYLSILNDEDYLKALEKADDSRKAIYVNDAKYIDEVQKGIIKIAKKEDPFDIFICYKESKNSGERTEDSIKAQEIYDELTEAGYKVFFSRITLESKVGIEYEPYIYAALSSSKVMIHITSSRDNSNAVWVKNEWSRYLSLMNQNTGKVLIPVYFGMDKTELPDEFKNISSYDLESPGFKQELIRGIKKIIPHSVTEKKNNWIVPVISVAVLVVAIGIGAVLYTRNKADKEAAISLASSLAETTTIATTIETTTKETEDPELREAYNAAEDLAYEGKYAEAAWAYKKLGDFDDASEQYDEMISSWRRSNALVCADVSALQDIKGSYYISANGGLNTFDYNAGSLHSQYKINDHGKIASICFGTVLSVLYEDGYSDGCEYGDVIEQSPVYRLYGPDGGNSFRLTLLSDGSVTVCDAEDYNTYYDDDDFGLDWLESFDDWNEIIDIVYPTSFYEQDGCPSLIIGIKSDGTLRYVFNTEYFMSIDHREEQDQELYDFLDGATNVTKASVYYHYGTYSIALVFEDGTASLFSANGISIYDSGDIVDVDLSDDKYICFLHSDGRLTNAENDLLMTDVVYVFGGYAITRSGTIYHWLEETEGKVHVYDEWEKG